MERQPKFEIGDIIQYINGGLSSTVLTAIIIDKIDRKYLYSYLVDINIETVAKLLSGEGVKIEGDDDGTEESFVLRVMTEEESDLWFKLSDMTSLSYVTLFTKNIVGKDFKGE